MQSGVSVGYFVPEFPGQTHNFFWREIQALRDLGIAVHLVSTRRPPSRLRSTSWGEQARTTYLYPFGASDLVAVLAVLLFAGPASWIRCLRGIAQAEDVSSRQRLRMVGLILAAAKLVGIARRVGFQHVHVQSCADSANVALFAHWLSGLTYSLTLHGSLWNYGGNQRQKWGSASFAAVLTNQMLGAVRGVLGGSMPSRMIVAPMGVDTGFFSRDDAYTPYSGPNELRLFCCGRLNPGKGHDLLVSAIKQLRDEGLLVSLEIAGEDDLGGSGYRIALEATIARLELGHCVSLLGAISEEAVRNCLSHTHLFVLASLEEALGVSLMEAMAMEVPVIATITGGVPELVASGVEGLLVTPGSVAELADAIKTIAFDPELATRFGAHGRQKIVAGFSSRRSAGIVAELLSAQG